MNSAAANIVLDASGLCKTFVQGRWWQKHFCRHALDNVRFSLRKGETLGLVGRSGCGKTTLAMCLVGLEQLDDGEIVLDGQNLQTLDKSSAAAARRGIQLIFQDSSSALNPRMTAMEIVEEPLLICGRYARKERWDVAAAMMERVGISPKWSSRLPSEFSGGQRQRLAIARALVLRPKVLILDEILVGLDLSIQNQIANLLTELQRAHGLSYLCISHDLRFVSQIADTIAVMDDGRIVEEISPSELFASALRSSPDLSPNSQPRPFALGLSSGA